MSRASSWAVVGIRVVGWCGKLALGLGLGLGSIRDNFFPP